MLRAPKAPVRRALLCVFVSLAVCLCCSSAVRAEGTPGVQIVKGGKIDGGDTAWMLVSSALVLMMTGPGLALFYGGLVRRKNVLATMMQSFILMGLVSILWAVIGYSLAFDTGTWFVGGWHFGFLHHVGADPCEY